MAMEDYTRLTALTSDESQHARGNVVSLSNIASMQNTRDNTGSSCADTLLPDPVAESNGENRARPSDTLHELYPISDLELPDHHIDDVRSLRVMVIGAGLSGIVSGIMLPAKVPQIQLKILEKNDDVVRS